MHIHVISSVNEARTEELQNKTVIVIDVLRATSTMLTALAEGSRAIIPVETVNQAKQLQRTGELLGGERFCKKISGFDFGNSPLEYQSEKIADKTVIMTTTNGTRAIQKASKAGHVLIGGFLNAASCAEKAFRLSDEIVLVCAGTQDVFALEDGLCAGMLISELLRLNAESPPRGTEQNQMPPEQVNDFGLAMLHAYRSVQDRLQETLLATSNGKRLSKIGFHDDVIYCAQTNLYKLAPEVHHGKIETVKAAVL